jgi:hypothetical protein
MTDKLHFLGTLVTLNDIVLIASEGLEALGSRALRALVDFGIGVAEFDGDVSNLFSLLLDRLIN